MGATVAFADFVDFRTTTLPNVSGEKDDQFYFEGKSALRTTSKTS